MKKFFIILITVLFFFHPILTYADVTSNVTVTAAVNPHPSDFQLTMSSNPTSATTINQFQNIIYTITYGSHLAYSASMTITASWSQGTINGQSSPSVDIADYVLGSATNAYNSTPPVVDTVNRTITWTIASLPANTTDQTVSFTLQTNASYTGTQTVTFPTTAHIDVQGTTVPDQSVTMTYQYNPVITPSPTPSPTATLTPIPSFSPTPTSFSPSSTIPTSTSTPSRNNTPTSLPTVTPTATIIQQNLTITNVSIDAISPTSAAIQTMTNVPAAVSVAYGTEINALDRKSDVVTGINQLLQLSNLQAHTRYYFRVTATSGNENFTSEIFTFITATASPTVQIDNSSLIVTSGSTLLYSVAENVQGNLHETIVLPTNKPFQFTFSVSGKNDIKKIEAFIRNTQTVGTTIRLFEIQPNVYQGLLTTTNIPGLYGLYVHIFDSQGNITEKQLFSIKVVRPMTILSEDTHQPIDHALISIARLDIQTHKYAWITPQMFPIQNPTYTNISGEISYVLPQGSYQVIIHALGYEQKKVNFTLGYGLGEDYPIVFLHKAGFSITTIIETLKTLLGEIGLATTSYFAEIGSSKILALLLSTITLVCFCLLSLLSLALRLHINVFLLPWLLLYRLRQLLFKERIIGKVIDEKQGMPVSQAMIVVIDGDKNKILYKTKTNPAGEFSYTPTDTTLYKIAVEKIGYQQHPFFEFSKEAFAADTLLLPIERDEEAVSIGMYIAAGCKQIISLSLEIIFITTCLLEIICGYYIGFPIILPFIALSVINLIILFTNLHSYKYLQR